MAVRPPRSAPAEGRAVPDAASRPVGSSCRCRPCGCTRSPASPTATAASRTPPPASPRRCATPSTPPWAPSPAPCASRAAAEVMGRPPAQLPSSSGIGGKNGGRLERDTIPKCAQTTGFCSLRAGGYRVLWGREAKPAGKKRWEWARRSPRVERTRTEQTQMVFVGCNVFLFIR